jgi:UDP-2-acetamido-2,6-beta-L-arabino-hexul-4-ose reductase
VAGVRVLVTGAHGFLGRNLCVGLERQTGVEVTAYDLDSPAGDLERALASVDVIFHLAGVNRPDRVEDFHAGNAGFTRDICTRLAALGRRPTLVLSSSIQAELDNPYGRSKRAAEEETARYRETTGAAVAIYRLKNLFGKWCRPNYNSVTATFCHNIARGLPIQISDPTNVVDLTHVDDVVAAFLREAKPVDGHAGGVRYADPLPSYRRTLGELEALIRSFRDQRTTLRLPDFSDPFVLALYGTYLSYLEPGDFAYDLEQRTDPRGALAEFVKQGAFGQVFVSRTKPGITRGNHYHDTKCEKFLVVEGDAIIRFRHLITGDLIEYSVSGEQFRVVDIPPGYTHSIENVGTRVLVTLFWSDQILDQERPDTHFRLVLPENEAT